MSPEQKRIEEALDAVPPGFTRVTDSGRVQVLDKMTLQFVPEQPTVREELVPGGASRDKILTRYDLVPLEGLRRVAATAHEGAEKYGPRNWEKGIPISNLLNHAMAHIVQYLSGDRSEDHLGHASWNLMAACDSEVRWPHLNTDIPQAPFNSDA